MDAGLHHRDLALAGVQVSSGVRRVELSAPDIHCGGCIRKIETALNKLTAVISARVNLSTRRVTVCFREDAPPPPIKETLSALGFDAHIASPVDKREDKTLSSLLYALAVAAFAAMNIMMFSVAVWAGASGDMRHLFHWLSAAIALPALLYSGRIFFASALRVLRRGQTNMDVPISVGLIVTYAMSLYDTMAGGDKVYFDAATALLFFLLIGRTLDHMMRARARSAIAGLERMAPIGVDVIGEAGSAPVFMPLADVKAGMLLRLAPGDRIPVDAMVEKGCSDIDVSLVNGESAPQRASPGAALCAGALNLTGPLTLRATSTAATSFLADMIRLMEAAEQSKGRYRRLADRVSALYAPVVHLAAAAAFLVWYGVAGDLHQALTIAVSVLIITCPCALALAVPMVQVRAAARLFEAGILMKDGGALERAAEIDHIVFDKTGTLTSGAPKLLRLPPLKEHERMAAALLASTSRHPHARAIAAALDGPGEEINGEIIKEYPGDGVEGRFGDDVYRLGRARWALENNGAPEAGAEHTGPLLTKNGKAVAAFDVEDVLRPEAAYVVSGLEACGYDIEILSGDSECKVAAAAAALGVDNWCADLRPDDKLRRLQHLTAAGRRPFMAGDGVNDAPALAAAHASVAPANAADIGRNAADYVLQKPGLGGVATIIDIAGSARSLTRQNIAFAIVYNIIAVPFAFAGFVTPLFAAIAMSASSLIVTANAFRLRSGGGALRRARP